jgi:hypothetical protein
VASYRYAEFNREVFLLCTVRMFLQYARTQCYSQSMEDELLFQLVSTYDMQIRPTGVLYRPTGQFLFSEPMFLKKQCARQYVYFKELCNYVLKCVV